MNLSELNNTEYLLYDSNNSSYGYNQQKNKDMYNNIDKSRTRVSVYSENPQQTHNISHTLRQSNHTNVSDKLHNERSDDHKFCENECNTQSFIKLIDAYKKKNDILQDRIKYTDQVCNLQLDFSNSGQPMVDTASLKYYVKLEIFMLILLLVLIISYSIV